MRRKCLNEMGGNGDFILEMFEKNILVLYLIFISDMVIGKWKFNKVIFSIYFNIFLYVICFWI